MTDISDGDPSISAELWVGPTGADPDTDPAAFDKFAGTLNTSPTGLAANEDEFEYDFMTNTPGMLRAMGAMMEELNVKPEIEAFDLSHIFRATEMHAKGQIKDTPYVQFVMGVKNAMPVDAEVFGFYIETVKRLFGADAEWCAAGIGPNQIVLNEWAIKNGGHVRTGLEDNVRLNREVLAASNAQLVNLAVEIAERYERPVATWAEARGLLGLPAPL